MAVRPRTAGGWGALRRALPTRHGLFLSVAAGWLLVTTWWLASAVTRTGHQHTGTGTPWWRAALQDLAGWQAMTVTMMVPTLVPVIGYLTRYTLRRWRAVWLFLTGYLLVWAGYGALLALAAVPLRAGPGATGGPDGSAAWLAGHPGWLAGGCLTVAAAWQLTAAKRLRLRGCHSPGVLPAHGLRADAAALRYGLRHGGNCVGACWAIMLVMALGMFIGGVNHLTWMIIAFAVVWAEKMQIRARPLAAPTAALFTTLAAAHLLLGAG